MNHLFDITFSWTNMFWLIALLALVYGGLILTRRLLKEWGPTCWKNGYFINSLLIPFELLAFVLLIAAFIWINPARHAIIAFVIFLLGLKSLKNYFSGRVLLVFRDLKVGQRIESLQNKGIIKDINRYGIQLSTSKGIQFLDYTQLTSSSYTILTDASIGGYYDIKISPTQPVDNKNYIMAIKDLLAITPFIDQKHFPTITASRQGDNQYNVRLMVREESHLRELMSLLDESGFKCKISKK